MTSFCVECGSEDGVLPDGVCRACRVRGTSVAELPPHVDITVCAHCGSLEEGAHWAEAPTDPVRLAAERAEAALRLAPGLTGVRIEPTVTSRDERNFVVSLAVSANVVGSAVAGSATTLVRVKRATCLRCSRIHGGYFEAVVQIRGDGRPMRANEKAHVRARARALVDRLYESGDRNAFVMKDIDEHGGIDLYMGTITSGRVLSKMLSEDMGAKITETSTLAGRKGGRDLVRMTFGIRLPKYFTGDIIVVDEELYLVRAVRSRTVGLLRMVDGGSTNMDRNRLGSFDVVPQEWFQEAIVVSDGPREVQVLDPETLRTLDFPRPAWLPRGVPQVRIVRYHEALFLVPPAEPAPSPEKV